MESAELDRQIAEVLEKGFDGSFAVFCAKTFSSFSYPAQNLAAARMHAHYMRMALEALSDPEMKARLLSGAPLQAGDRWTALCLSVGAESYRSALESDRPVCELFVEGWCRLLAS